MGQRPSNRTWGSIVLIATLVVAIGLLVRMHLHRAIASVAIGTGTQAANRAVVNYPTSVPRPAATKAGTVEICGYGSVPIDSSDSDSDSINGNLGKLAKGAESRWLSALKDSGDLRARVAGLLLEDGFSSRLKHPVAEQTSEAVVQLAAGTEDPAVYAMAVTLCGTYAGTGTDVACQQISLQRWAQLDPDNSVPWLLLAGNALQRHNTAEEAEAFNQAAEAHKIDAYDSLYSYVAPELPQDATALERAYLAITVIGVEAATWTPQYLVADQLCSDGAMQDIHVRQQCDSLAKLFVSKGTNLLDLGFGRRIGARAGWSSQRVNELAQEEHALMQATMQASPYDNEKL
jgi:hypothetical protein